MKTVGDVLSTLFDERFVNKAQGYSRLFESWADIAAKNGIAAAADHSRIRELDRGCLLIETDHPGWKQIIQTKQSILLDDFRSRFPNLGISGISLMLDRGKPKAVPSEVETVASSAPSYGNEEIPRTSYDAIKDEELKDMLKRLERRIADREKA
jgi:Tat protein secretion system quality control protein TatD with DNase activity